MKSERLVRGYSIALALALIALHISGDYVFYKTNTLNLSILWASSIVLATLLPLSSIANKQSLVLYLIISFIPVILTLPGLLINGEGFRYFSLHEYSVRVVTILFGLYSLVYFFAAKSHINVVFTLAFVGTVLSLVGILEWFGLEPLIRLRLNTFEFLWLNEPLGYSGPKGRIASTAGHPNYLAAIVIILIPILVASLMCERDSQSVFFIALVSTSVLLLTINLFLTGSRAALLGFVTSSFFYFSLYQAMGKPIQIWSMLLIIGLSVFLLLTNSSMVERLIAVGSDTSSLTRLAIWKAAINSIVEAPFTGYGIGTSYALFFTFSDPEPNIQFIRSFLHPHNSLLEAFQEGGLLALGACVFIYSWLSKKTLAFVLSERIPMNERVLVLGCASSLIALSVQGLFSVAPRMVIVLCLHYGLLAHIIFKLTKHGFFSFSLISAIPLTGIQKYLKLIILCALVLIGFWLIPYLAAQHANAKTLSDYYEAPNETLAVADKIDDVYLLDRAINGALYQRDYSRVFDYVARQESLISDYRLTRHQYAYALYKSAQFSAAYPAALNAQNSNPYYLQTIQLLINESIIQKDFSLFAMQFELMIRKLMCQSHRNYCGKNSVLVNHNKKLEFVVEESSLVVSFDQNFFSNVIDLSRAQESKKDAYFEVRKILSRNEFFTPKKLLSFTQDQLKDVNRYLKLKKQQDQIEVSLRDLHVASGKSILKDIQLYFERKSQLSDQLIQIEETKQIISMRLGASLDLEMYAERYELNRKVAQNLIDSVFFDQ